MDNPYETDGLLQQYLVFHYGSDRDQMPWPDGPKDGLHYPERCVTECLDPEKLPENARALDLGCAVGRSSFELARFCTEVVGIDFSESFIQAARNVAESGHIVMHLFEEGFKRRREQASLPAGIDRSRVRFETGDAGNLREDLGTFDVILMANLVDRLPDPAACLKRLSDLARPGAQLIITSPYTWMESFTPKENWLHTEDEPASSTIAGILNPDFILEKTLDLPFLIREHRRKFQWSMAQATVWIRTGSKPEPNLSRD